METFSSDAIHEYLKQGQETNPLISAIDTEIALIRESLPKEITTPEGIFAATYLEASARVMRPLFVDSNLKNSPLLATIGDPEHSHHRGIDLIGGIIVDRVISNMPDLPYSKIRVKEIGGWLNIHKPEEKKRKPQRYVIMDPCDMASMILEGKPVQTTGIAIYDAKGTLLSGGIVSFTHQSQVFVERKNKTYTIIESHEPATKEPPQVAFLANRLEDKNSVPAFIKKIQKDELFPCVSGASVLGLRNGSVSLILDPAVGQPWYELVIWGKIAEILGHPVRYPKGNTINFAALVKWGAIYDTKENPLQIPMVIAQSEAQFEQKRALFWNGSPRYSATARILDVFERIAGLGPVDKSFIARVAGSSISMVDNARQLNSQFCKVRGDGIMVLPQAEFVSGGTGHKPSQHKDTHGTIRHVRRNKRRFHGAAAAINHSGEPN